MSALPPVVASGLPYTDADLLAQLVDEDGHGVGLGDDAGQLAQSLGHQPGLQAHVACRPSSPSISAWGTRAATESMTTMSMAPERTSASADFQGLLAVVGLRDVAVRRCPRPGALA